MPSLTRRRVIAVSIPDHKELWSSSSLAGYNVGSPVIYQTRNEETYVALTHNSELLRPDNSTITTGRITMLRADEGRLLWTESEWSRDEIPTGYGPPGIASNPIAGKYVGGELNSNDIIVWTSSDKNGRGNLGYSYALQLPRGFTGSESEVDGLATIVLKKVRWTAVSRPTFSRNGTNMFFGVTGSQLRGWRDDTSFDSTAKWASDISGAESDPVAGMYQNV